MPQPRARCRFAEPLRALGVPLAWLVASLAGAPEASAQTSSATGSLERFQPAEPGDAMFGVPSPAVGGHLVPRATVLADFALNPLRIEDGAARYAIVSRQLFLHVGMSLALWDRILVSVDMPFALLQGGESPTIAGHTFPSPSAAQVGDLRLGARLRLYGDYWDPFQIGVGGYVFVPTAPKDGYAGDGAVRGQPHLLIGGRFRHFVYSASLGTAIHASARPHAFDARAGAAVVLADDFVQLGPEVTVSAPFTKDVLLNNSQARIAIASPVSAELLLGAEIRPIRSLVIGAGAGPGLTQGWGTPQFFAVTSVGYDPQPRRPGEVDTDGDGIFDPVDACPTVKGVKSDDPKKHGCPPDVDGDGIYDVDDACPKVPGVKSDDPKKHGCPPDTDGDGIYDNVDACPQVPGVKNDDPKKNGCPPDADGDGIYDNVDACPQVPGVKNDDPKKHGCPPDTDEDGIPDAEDACPKEKGPRDPDPKKNGCPLVTVTKKEIVINRQVQFKFGKSTLDQTVDPVSDELLTEVRDAIDKHPEITLIEVQGHADIVGTDEYNQKLSQARADAVRGWLIKRGIPADKLVAKGYGSKVPKAANDSVEGRKENRRVQFIIIKNGANAP